MIAMSVFHLICAISLSKLILCVNETISNEADASFQEQTAALRCDPYQPLYYQHVSPLSVAPDHSVVYHGGSSARVHYYDVFYNGALIYYGYPSHPGCPDPVIAIIGQPFDYPIQRIFPSAFTPLLSSDAAGHQSPEQLTTPSPSEIERELEYETHSTLREEVDAPDLDDTIKSLSTHAPLPGGQLSEIEPEIIDKNGESVKYGHLDHLKEIQTDTDPPVSDSNDSIRLGTDPSTLQDRAQLQIESAVDGSKGSIHIGAHEKAENATHLTEAADLHRLTRAEKTAKGRARKKSQSKGVAHRLRESQSLRSSAQKSPPTNDKSAEVVPLDQVIKSRADSPDSNKIDDLSISANSSTFPSCNSHNMTEIKPTQSTLTFEDFKRKNHALIILNDFFLFVLQLDGGYEEITRAALAKFSPTAQQVILNYLVNGNFSSDSVEADGGTIGAFTLEILVRKMESIYSKVPVITSGTLSNATLEQTHKALIEMSVVSANAFLLSYSIRNQTYNEKLLRKHAILLSEMSSCMSKMISRVALTVMLTEGDWSRLPVLLRGVSVPLLKLIWFTVQKFRIGFTFPERMLTADRLLKVFGPEELFHPITKDPNSNEFGNNWGSLEEIVENSERLAAFTFKFLLEDADELRRELQQQGCTLQDLSMESKSKKDKKAIKELSFRILECMRKVVSNKHIILDLRPIVHPLFYRKPVQHRQYFELYTKSLGQLDEILKFFSSVVYKLYLLCSEKNLWSKEQEAVIKLMRNIFLELDY